jgi:hypothetical protein
MRRGGAMKARRRGLLSASALTLSALMLLTPSAPLAFAAPADPIRLELNAVENVQQRCRLSFVIENKGPVALSSLKLDLVVFGRDGVIDRRLIAELAPLRGAKTVVKTFEVEDPCADIGSVLVNGVTACAPGDADACLDRLVLSSRLNDIRLFK